MNKFVSYHRVSTKRQGASGLGLEGQKKAVTDYLNGGSWELIGEFVEVESGKRSNNRPELKRALALCEMTGATLVIAKLDRLARNVAFISALMESGVPFVACDMPHANKFTIHVLAAVAEQEAEAISARTKAALAASKERVEAGLREAWKQKRQLTDEDKVRGRLLGDAAKTAKADKFAQQVRPMIEELQGQGLSLRGVASALNDKNILTARGKHGAWTATTVKNVLGRG